MSATFWEKPISELSYYEKLRRGICAECNREGVLIVEADYEYTYVLDKEVKRHFTGLRCSKCKKGYLPVQLLPMAERFT